MTIQEYYNEFAYGHRDNTPKCEFCGKDRKWGGPAYLYSVTCASDSCRKDLRRKMNQMNKWDRLNKLRLTAEERKNSSEFKWLNSISSAYVKFLTNGHPLDHAEFYIAITHDDKFKFGIAKDSYGRARYRKYKNFKVLCYTNRLKAGLVEFLIKLEVDSSKEYSDSTFEFRQAYNKYRGLFYIDIPQ